jgi:hypothetical protein
MVSLHLRETHVCLLFTQQHCPWVRTPAGGPGNQHKCAMQLWLQVGTYTFTVTSSSGPVVVSNSPLTVNVFPAATAADASAFYVDVPAPAVGAVVTVTVYPRDRDSTPLPLAVGVQLTIQGMSCNAWISRATLTVQRAV